MDNIMKTATVQVDDQTGEYYIEFDEETMKAAGLKVGDNVIWEDNKNGSWSLRKEE